MKRYKLVLGGIDGFWYWSTNLEFLICKLEFFCSHRQGLTMKPYIVDITTGRIIYE